MLKVVCGGRVRDNGHKLKKKTNIKIGYKENFFPLKDSQTVDQVV